MHRTNITRQGPEDITHHYSPSGTWVTVLTDSGFKVTEHFSPDSKTVVYDSTQRIAISQATPPLPLRADYLEGYSAALKWLSAEIEENLIPHRLAILEEFGPSASAVAPGTRYGKLAVRVEAVLTEVAALNSACLSEDIAVQRKLKKLRPQ